MTTAFPGAVDNFTNPTASDPLDSVTVPHAAQHANINDAVEAIETYILANPAAPTFGFTSGLYYRGLGTQFQATAVVNETVYVPFLLGETKTFDRIALETRSTYSGTGSVRLGIYNNDSTTGKPSTVVLDAGTVSTTAATTIYQITISQSLTAGAYWLAFNMQTAAATPTFGGVITNAASSIGYLTSTTGAVYPNAGLWLEAGVTGAFATAGTLTSALFVASCTLRVV